MDIIRTQRLDLIPAPPKFLELVMAGDRIHASELLGVIVPDGWPVDEAAYAGLPLHLQAMREDERELLWRIRLIVLRKTRRVIGSISLKGPPNENGDVEIGWGVIAEHRGRGIAVEAANAVIRWAVVTANVSRVIATIPENNFASIQVAQRLGFHQTRERKRDLPV